jgi:hypothetical protein
MASIERTVYPRFTRAPSVKELREIYTPTPTDVAFVATKARGPAQKFALMILLMVYQRLHYFPDPQSIPGALISHIRAVMKLPEGLVPDISPATLYRYYGVLREHLELNSQGKHARHVAAQAMHAAAQVITSSPSSKRSMRVGTSPSVCPNKWCSRSCQPAPTPRIMRPPLKSSNAVA